MLSKADVKKELVTCGRDLKYFVDNYVLIRHPMRGIIPFKLYDYQKQTLDDFLNYRFNIVLKARQLGLSTLTEAYCLWLMLFHKAKSILTVATKQKVAAKLVRAVADMYKRLPTWMRFEEVVVDNAAQFTFANGSTMSAESTGASSGRSEAASLLVCDEAHWIDGLSDLWTGLYPILSTGGSAILISTPNGPSGFFYDMYIGAEAKKNDFHAIKLPWWLHEERDENWFMKETKNMSQRQIAQELLCSFNESGTGYFENKVLQRILNEIEEPFNIEGHSKELHLWKKYNSSNTYFITADVARGDGEDYSAAIVYCVQEDEVVAEFKGQLATDLFARFLNELGQKYGNCLLVVENAQSGWATLQELINLKYPNLYYQEKGTGKMLDPLIAEYVDNSVPGFTTSSKTRPIIIGKFEEMTRNNEVKIRSKRLYEEMCHFAWIRGKPQAQKGKNDDLIMAASIACWIRESVYETIKKNLTYKKALLDGISVRTSNIQTSVIGMQGYDIKRDPIIRRISDQYKWLYTS